MRFEVDTAGLRTAGSGFADCSSSLGHLFGGRWQELERELRESMRDGEPDALSRALETMGTIREGGMRLAALSNALACALVTIARTYERVDDDALYRAPLLEELQGGRFSQARTSSAEDAGTQGLLRGMMMLSGSEARDGVSRLAWELFQSMVRPL